MLDKPIAYTYEADYHCVDCTRERFAIMPTRPRLRNIFNIEVDGNGINPHALDNYGNPISAVFSTDELPTDLEDRHGGWHTLNCGDCRAIIATRHQSLEGGHNHD